MADEKARRIHRETTSHEWDGIRAVTRCRAGGSIYSASPLRYIGAYAGVAARQLIYKGRAQFLTAPVAADIETTRTRQCSPGLLRPARQTAADPELQTFARARQAGFVFGVIADLPGAGRAGARLSVADDVWIWGGSLAEIELRSRWRALGSCGARFLMPAYGRDGLLSAAEISVSPACHCDLGCAQRHARTRRPCGGRDLQACSCHGPTGANAWSAPSCATYDAWRFARNPASNQTGRAGVMPAWESRFDAGTLRAVAYYVHEMGGGEPDAAPTQAHQRQQRQ